MKNRSHIFTVSDRVPTEFVPLMAAFMSFFIRINVNSKTNSEKVKRVEPMIFRLLKFIYQPDEKTAKKWRRRKNAANRRAMIIDKITTMDGKIMTPMEQLEFFAELSRDEGLNIMCHLVKSKDGERFSTTKPGETFINIPVIQYSEEKYAATSNNYYAGHNFKPSFFKKKIKKNDE